jgi:hypothetical protein
MLALFDSNFSLCKYLKKREHNELLYDTELLRRAKLGLHLLAFFGLAEKQNLSRYLFEATFNNKLTFKNLAYDKKSEPKDRLSFRFLKSSNLTAAKKLSRLNRLDVELYHYAVKVFYKRLKHFSIL